MCKVNERSRFSGWLARASTRRYCGSATRGLLEALQGGVTGLRPREAITRHLTQLFGASRNFGSVREDYGVSVDAALGGAMSKADERMPVERLRAELLRNVVAFETGLLEPELDVRFRDARGNVYFELSAELADGSGAGAWVICFSTWSRTISVSEVR